MAMITVCGFVRVKCLNVNSNELITLNSVSLTLHNNDRHFEALKQINFCLRVGDHVGILGPNGSGKSTFLRLLAGQAWASQGSIFWHYNNQKETSPIMARRMCALVSPSMQEQYTKYQYALTGEDVLLTAFSGRALDISDFQKLRMAEEMAEQLKCLGLLKMDVAHLSQGQLRILLLGQALLHKPQVLLLDEYLDGLDMQARTHIMDILDQISKKTTLVISTHRKQGLIPCITKNLFLNAGKLCSARPQKEHISTQKLLANPSQQIPSIKPIIDVQNATIFMERKPILHNINWTLHTGEHWMIHGKNGSGKSTFLRFLAGYEYAAHGGNITRHFHRLYPQEQDSTKLTHIRQAIKLVSDYEQTCYSYDLTGLYLVLSGIDNVVGKYRSYNAEEIAKALNLLNHFGIKNLEIRRISTLSTGQLRRLFIARALMAKPEVLLLDEPFSALDETSRIECMQNLDALSHEFSIILVSHYTDDQLTCINCHAQMKNGTLTLLTQ